MSSSTAKRFVICHCGGFIAADQAHIQLFREALIATGFVKHYREEFVEVKVQDLHTPEFDISNIPNDVVILIDQSTASTRPHSEYVVPHTEHGYVKLSDQILSLLKTHRVILFQKDGFIPSFKYCFIANHVFQITALNEIIDLREGRASNSIHPLQLHSDLCQYRAKYTDKDLFTFLVKNRADIKSVRIGDEVCSVDELINVDDFFNNSRLIHSRDLRLIIEWKNTRLCRYNIYHTIQGSYVQLSGIPH